MTHTYKNISPINLTEMTNNDEQNDRPKLKWQKLDKTNDKNMTNKMTDQNWNDKKKHDKQNDKQNWHDKQNDHTKMTK